MRAGTRTLRQSFLWLGSASVVARLVDLIAIALVIGVISPHELGLASIVWTVITLSDPLASAGVQWAVLGAERFGRKDSDTALVLSVAAGALVTLLLLLSAPLLADWFHVPRLSALLSLGALKLVPAAAASVQQQRLARALRHRQIAAASAFAAIVSALLRVGLVFLGPGALALTLAHASYSWLLLAALWTMTKPGLSRFDMARARRLLPAGLSAMLSQALTQWARNLGHLFVGAFLGVAPLGLYRVAFDLAMEPANALGEVMGRSAGATLNKLRASPARLQHTFSYLLRLCLCLSLPLMALIFWFAPDLLALARDDSFTAASAATRWLAVAALLRIVFGLYAQLALALGRPALALSWSIELCALLALALWGCLTLLAPALFIASAGVAWCAALAVSLVSAHARLHRLLRGSEQWVVAAPTGARLTAARVS